MDSQPIPFILVTGFLGSGKTTLISHLLRKADPGLKIGLVENDYASASPDSRILAESGRSFDLMEVYSGSVFCVCLLGSFVPSLTAFLDEHRPELLLMEATGLADPIGIAEILLDPGLSSRLYLSSIWCVVDALNFSRISRVNTRVERQLQVADRVIINKADQAGNSVEALKQELHAKHPAARIEVTAYGRIAAPDFMAEVIPPRAVKIRGSDAGKKPLGRSDIRTFLLRTARPIAQEGLRAFMEEAGSMLIRIKGHVLVEGGPPQLVQHVYRETSYQPMPDYHGQTELVGMGWGVDNRAFGRRFHEIRKLMKDNARTGRTP